MSRMFDGLFQHGYLTTDLDHALDLYRERLGIKRFFVFDTSGMNAKFPLKVGLAWKDQIMIELIQQIGDPSPAYLGCLPSDGFAIRLHHLGYYTEDPAVFDAQLREADALELPCATRAVGTGFIDFTYYDARAVLGHHLEYVLAHPEGRAFLAQVPRN